MTLDEIKGVLNDENADESARMSAYGELLDQIENHVINFTEAYDVYNEHQNLGRDWAAEVVSINPETQA